MSINMNISMTQQRRHDYFVTGTDTEIGKTLASA